MVARQDGSLAPQHWDPAADLGGLCGLPNAQHASRSATDMDDARCKRAQRFLYLVDHDGVEREVGLITP